MNLCRDPAHPHCTVWVMPGDDACAHGHPQPASAAPAGLPALASAAPVTEAAPRPACPQALRPHLRVSGFDPRAAGGRQAIKLELRGMPHDCPAQLTMLLKSVLHLHCPERHAITCGARGEWCPAFVEFSSRGLEHGQHRIEVELHGRGADARPSRTWVCSLVILVPRADATLADIHHTFLSSHKNVRVFADDASIARVDARTGSGRIDIDVTARNAGIARLDLDASAPGKIDIGMPAIAWDEDLVEIDGLAAQAPHPYPARAACLVNPLPAPGRPRYMRLFAANDWVLGRFDANAPEADVLIAHHTGQGPVSDGLTRRISARHAVVRATADGFSVEDVSRYGLLVDGEWPGKRRPVALRTGTRLELTASVKGVAVLVVAAVLPNGLVLRRPDAGALAESFWLIVPGRDPGRALADRAGLPLLLHRDGGFWERDAATGADTALTPAGAVERARRSAPHFAGGPYPETWSVRAHVADRRRARAGAVLPA